MKFKEIFATALFALFLGLCGTELMTTIITTQIQTVETVRYTRGIEQNSGTEQKKQEKPAFNLNEILEETDVHG